MGIRNLKGSSGDGLEVIKEKIKLNLNSMDSGRIKKLMREYCVNPVVNISMWKTLREIESRAKEREAQAREQKK